MQNNRLKQVRVIVSLAVLIVLTAALVEGSPRLLSTVGGWLASVQFVPSSVALVSGGALSLACIVILLLTLLAGRIYCSFLCPLGTLQDIAIRLRSILEKKKSRVQYAKPATRVRIGFLLLTLIGIVSGWASIVLALLDPYSNYGRIVSVLIRPLIKFGGGTVLGWIRPAAADSWLETAHWASLGALAVPIIVLGLVATMAALRGRLYCNTVCPVGTLLGLISSRSAFRLQIDHGCRKCAKCARVCKTQCIDWRTGSLDNSRCVACYNCIGVCDGHFIGYRQSWILPQRNLKPALVEINTETRSVPDYRRRALLSKTLLVLAGGLATETLWAGTGQKDIAAASDTGLDGNRKERRAIRPPGFVSAERFSDHCTACQLCVSACPSYVLRPSSLEFAVSNLLKPRMSFDNSYCKYDCNRCGEVCPSGAIQALSLAEKQRTRLGLANVDESHCLVNTRQAACTICIRRCPAKAIETIPFGNNLHMPKVNALLCIGCGRCEYECPAEPEKAIKVAGLLRETHVPPNAPATSHLLTAPS